MALWRAPAYPRSESGAPPEVLLPIPPAPVRPRRAAAPEGRRPGAAARRHPGWPTEVRRCRPQAVERPRLELSVRCLGRRSPPYSPRAVPSPRPSGDLPTPVAPPRLPDSMHPAVWGGANVLTWRRQASPAAVGRLPATPPAAPHHRTVPPLKPGWRPDQSTAAGRRSRPPAGPRRLSTVPMQQVRPQSPDRVSPAHAPAHDPGGGRLAAAQRALPSPVRPRTRGTRR